MGSGGRLDRACAGGPELRTPLLPLGPSSHTQWNLQRAGPGCGQSWLPQDSGGTWLRNSRRAVGPAPEVVAPLLQLEGVVGPTVGAPSIQVTIPVDSDAHSTSLHTAHCSLLHQHAGPGTLSLSLPGTLPPMDPPAMPGPQRPLQLQPRDPQCGTQGSKGCSVSRSDSA